jgi:hypothetical protein
MVPQISPVKVIPAHPAPAPAPDSPPAITQNYPELPVLSTKCDHSQPAITNPDAESRAPQDISPLSDAQLQAIDLLMLGQSYTAIAQTLGITRKTLYNWRNEPAFRAHYDHRRREVFDAASARTLSMLDGALDVLQKLIKHPYHPTAHSAVRTLLFATRIGQHATTFQKPLPLPKPSP